MHLDHRIDFERPAIDPTYGIGYLLSVDSVAHENVDVAFVRTILLAAFFHDGSCHAGHYRTLVR